MRRIDRRILALARAGNPARAWALFTQQGLGEVHDDPKVLTLKGRLLKDRARLAERDGQRDEAREKYASASEAYRAAFALQPDSYPLINAATLALLSDDEGQARTLASEVLRLIEANPDEGENAYWREATRAEALILLGDQIAAEEALRRGIAKLPRAWEDHAATLGQFAVILARQGEDSYWLDAYRPPTSVHFSGLIGLDPDDPAMTEDLIAAIEYLRPGFGFGALAAGADILIAEALVRSGAQLFITLPAAVERFRSVSVEPFGAHWADRFDALVAQAESVDVLAAAIAEEDLPLAKAVELATLVSMGEALRRAQTLHSHVHALTIAVPGEDIRTPIKQWTRANLPLQTIAAARVSQPGSEVDPADRRRIAMIVTSSTGDAVTVEDLQSGLATLRACSSAAKETPTGMMIELVEGDSATPDQIQRAKTIAQTAPAGAIHTDRQSAMIATVIDPSIRIEEFGELPSMRGPVPLWSIAF